MEFYWRPGCPFCARLRWNLRRARLPVSEINIWDDPAAAAGVRWITGGDETVPTVVVGARAMVNPSVGQVLDAVRAEAPDLPARSGRRRRRGGLAEAVRRSAAVGQGSRRSSAAR
ncbi:MAG: NrdH-redoxin [Streptosporangiales bacterium]|nr:NrdH-redoxin [Streptosporangiales bacterium]